ncbi:BolA family protein [Leptothoe sp. PORK10 BA2]|uniref:BolA family protein n=1 Tax=Leptothoe sp. PORK10 BA2 TaxID=3110254 RepID=UPI002B1FC424|nr:BolA/IbaG family iron-sulfur metabolism protein [Leptothoe sp. PORK10 BA2]MEA5463155.1 BolA/IbaG family iron-sulfur metabolism protein [Leptothoe sp. PORK10 BA2]
MIPSDQVEQLIKAKMPDAEVIVQDLTGTQDHYQATIVSTLFEGLSLVKQHQLVYGSVNAVMASGALHALTLRTFTPDEWAQQA